MKLFKNMVRFDAKHMESYYGDLRICESYNKKDKIMMNLVDNYNLSS